MLIEGAGAGALVKYRHYLANSDGFYSRTPARADCMCKDDAEVSMAAFDDRVMTNR